MYSFNFVFVTLILYVFNPRIKLFGLFKTYLLGFGEYVFMSWIGRKQ